MAYLIRLYCREVGELSWHWLGNAERAYASGGDYHSPCRCVYEFELAKSVKLFDGERMVKMHWPNGVGVEVRGMLKNKGDKQLRLEATGEVKRLDPEWQTG